VIARRLHAAGYNVAVADLMPDKAHAVAQSLDASGATAIALALDIRNKADFEASRDALIAKWGSVQVLVNNAAVTLHTPVMRSAPRSSTTPSPPTWAELSLVAKCLAPTLPANAMAV
jgi:3-oxoacyl-[acyl-carrier protein] reductase